MHRVVGPTLSWGWPFVLMAAVQIKREILEAIVRHAQEEAPLECCGLLMGEGEIITRQRPMQNVLESNVGYAMEAQALFRFFKDLRSANQKHLGIYHSHPATEAYPSETDVRESFYPSCAYFIVSLKNPESPQVRAFRIRDGVEELEIIGVD
ncbi:MAG: M67 family peptidase [Acidobacteria bacterium]|nr:M67 family peptidase [Acidobacteriota bacterium]